MFKYLLAALAIVVAAALPVSAGYINIPAGAFSYPTSNPATSGCVTDNFNTHCYASFSGSVDQYAHVQLTVPQDAPASPQLNCSFIGYDHATADNNQVKFSFSAQAYPDGANISDATALVYSTDRLANSGTAVDDTFTATAATAYDIYDVANSGVCGSSACSGKPLVLVLRRSGSSDASADAIRLIRVVCSY